MVGSTEGRLQNASAGKPSVSVPHHAEVISLKDTATAENADLGPLLLGGNI